MFDLRQKILAVFGDQPILGSFATMAGGNKPWARYVMARAHQDMSITFATFADSRKASQVRANPEVHFLGGVNDPAAASHWVQVEGSAEVLTDAETRNAAWTNELKDYFSGPDDPNYCVIRIKPRLVEYWGMGSMEPEVWRAD